MARIPNTSRAYVNCSNTKIPVYKDGNLNVNQVIGHIYPNEMYTVIPVDAANPDIWYVGVMFRNKEGKAQTGYILAAAREASVDPAYASQQVLFHRRNSNGKTLVPATAVTINKNDSNKYMIFTVKKEVTYYVGETLKGTLKVGARVATDGSTVGKKHPSRLSIDYVDTTGKGNWTKLSNGWVSLGFSVGSTPSNRALY